MKNIKLEFFRKLESSELFFKRSDQGKAMMEAAHKQATETLREIRDRIIGGESSGDEITDFVFRHRLGATMGMVERYHSLANAIAAHQDELVLVIEREEVDSRFHSHLELKPHDWRLRTHCAVGIIRDTKLLLDMERGVSSIPTGGQHLTFSGDPAWHFVDVVIEPNEVPGPSFGNIQARSLGRDLGASLGTPLCIKNPRTRELLEGLSCCEIEMVVGDEKVSAWFRESGKIDLHEQVAAYLDPRPAQPKQ